MNIAAYIFLYLGILSATIGVLGFYRFNNIFSRLLISANIDSLGMIFIMIGLIITSPGWEIRLKAIIILILSLITTPLSSNAIARSVYYSGNRVKE